MSNKAMYILVNEDIKIGKGKLAGQVGHAVCVYMYRGIQQMFFEEDSKEQMSIMSHMDEYMLCQKKIILRCPQSKLEELEKIGYITIRDKGLTQLEPNTLTCINVGILDKEQVPDWIQEMKLYSK